MTARSSPSSAVGCGKTTALRIAMGLETASGAKSRRRREVRGCGHDRGMVFQFAELLPWLTRCRT